MTISPSISHKIKNMSFLCAALVVAIHVPPWYGGGELSLCSIDGFMHHFVAQGVARIAVPFFFLCSGFFLAKHFSEGCWWRNAMATRVRTLLVPYFLWCGLSCLCRLPLSLYTDYVTESPFGTHFVSDIGGFVGLFGLDFTVLPPMSGALWYLRALFFARGDFPSAEIYAYAFWCRMACIPVWCQLRSVGARLS